jgi:uncharacterized membrane protein YGL010W
MPDVNALFADYASYHQTKGNKAFHRVGIPLIMLSLIGMLAHVHLWRLSYSLDFVPVVHIYAIDAAMLLILVAELYYLAAEWRLAIGMLVVSVIFYVIGAALPLWVNVVLFILGWVFQFIGHSVYEHKQPAFFRNFAHLLVGPLWILNDIVPVVKRA